MLRQNSSTQVYNPITEGVISAAIQGGVLPISTSLKTLETMNLKKKGVTKNEISETACNCGISLPNGFLQCLIFRKNV
jgi:hypothetical protein